MSGEYISREAALEVVERYFTELLELNPDICLDGIKAIPAADVVEVRHGRWIQKGRKIYCSKCNHGVYIGTEDEGLMQDEMHLRHFCSACGAKMDGGQNDD